jgi:hypothetical protein
VNEKLLRIYLQDHLAGATVGLELARRARGANRGTAYGAPLAKLADEIEADRRALEGIMQDLGFGPDRVKNVVAWTAEKAGRLKLNGQLTGYSPLSRLEELEILSLGVAGKLAMWQALEHAGDRGIPQAELETLIKRARSQRRRLERQRLDAAAEALGSATST